MKAKRLQFEKEWKKDIKNADKKYNNKSGNN